MTHTTPSANARDALSSARSAHYALRDAYADPSRPPAAGTAADLNTAIRYGLKVAEVEAALAIAGEVERVANVLREVLLAGAPSTAEVTRRLDGSAVPAPPSAIHHPSCPARATEGGECAGCPLPRPRLAPSTAEVTRRLREAGQ